MSNLVSSCSVPQGEGRRPGRGIAHPVRAALTSRVAAPGLVREGKMGKPRPASAQRPLPRAGGGAPSEIWKPAWTPIYRRGRHLGRNEDPLFRSAAGRNGTLVATAGAARAPGAWAQALRPHGRRDHARRDRTDQDLARVPHWREETLQIRPATTVSARGPLRDRAVAGFVTSIRLRLP